MWIWKAEGLVLLVHWVDGEVGLIVLSVFIGVSKGWGSADFSTQIL